MRGRGVDARVVERWTRRLVEVRSPAELDESLARAALELTDARGAAVWRSVRVAGEERLVRTATAGEPDDLPTPEQASAVFSGRLGRDSLARTVCLGSPGAGGAPALTIATPGPDESALDAVEALLTLAHLCELDADVSPGDALRGPLRSLEPREEDRNPDDEEA